MMLHYIFICISLLISNHFYISAAALNKNQKHPNLYTHSIKKRHYTDKTARQYNRSHCDKKQLVGGAQHDREKHFIISHALRCLKDYNDAYNHNKNHGFRDKIVCSSNETVFALPKHKHVYVDIPLRKEKMNPAPALQCKKLISRYESRYKIPKNTLYAIALVESGTSCRGSSPLKRYAWPWTVKVPERQGVHFHNKSEALKFCRNYISAGVRSIDVGCMQINMSCHSHAFESLDAALDPEKNIEYAAKHLLGHYKQCKNWSSAIGRCHSKDVIKGHQYYTKVMQAKKEIKQYG